MSYKCAHLYIAPDGSCRDCFAPRSVTLALVQPYPDPARCPAVIVESLRRYADHGVPTGDFLRAVLENDLKEAVGRADHINGPALAHIVSYCYNEIPSTSWGSPAIVAAWIEKHRADAERTKG